MPGSAAAAAGVREGDVVVAVNDRRIDDGADLRNAIGLFRVGQEIELQVVRNDREHRLHARIDQAPLQQVAGERLHPRLEGAVFSAWPNHGSGKSGVWVRAVTGASPAWNSGLRADDVIIAVNRRLVQGIEQFTLVASRADTLLLNLQRNGGAYALAIR